MVVVGVGEAGANMATAVYELVKHEKVDKYFQFILIDSNESELQREEIPKEIKQKITLRPPDNVIAIREDLKTFKYLYKGVNIQRKGALRQRVVARYFVDRKYDDLRISLYNITRDFADKHMADLTEEGNSLTITLLHSVGGGTGSGSFPILTAMLNGIKRDLEKELAISVSICGVGSMPTLPEDIAAPVEGDPVYYANAFAVFKEIEKLLEDKELVLPLYYTVAEVGKPLELKIEGLPFDKYFLVGINEGELKRGIKEEWVEAYIEEKNRSIANCLLALHEHRSLSKGDWPVAGGGGSEYAIGSFAEHEIKVPVRLLEVYVRKREELDSKMGELKGVKEEIKNKIEDIKRLQAVNISPDDVPEALKKDVEAMVTRELQTGIMNISEAELEDFVKGELKKGFGIEGEVYGVKLLTNKFDEMKYTEEWGKKVEELWERYGLGNKDKYKNKTTIRDKDESLHKWLLEVININKAWLENPPRVHLPGEKKRKQNLIERLESEKDDLEAIKRKSEQLERLKGKTAELNGEVKNELLDEISRKTEAKNSREDRVRRLEDEIKALERDIKATEDGLSKSKFGRVGYLQLKSDKVKDITGEELDRLDSLKKFVERGYIDIQDVRRGLETQIKRAKGWSSISVRDARHLSLFLLCNGENAELISELSAEVIPQDYSSYELRDKYTIKACFFQVGMKISDITDFRLIKERYEEGILQKALERVGRKVEESFAYPEWFSKE